MTTHEIVTDVGAVAAIASPWWLKALHLTSEFAAQVLPILGVIWLLIQIVMKVGPAVLDWMKGRKRRRK